MNSRQEYKFHPRTQKIEREDSSPHSISGRSGYSAGGWRSYLPQELTPSRTHEAAHYEQEGRVGSILRERREEERRRQESALKKVRELQQRVMPLVRGGREEQGAWVGWQSRAQQRLLRLQGQVDNMRKEMQLVLEKRMVELQNKWQQRFAQLLPSGQQQ